MKTLTSQTEHVRWAFSGRSRGPDQPRTSLVLFCVTVLGLVSPTIALAHHGDIFVGRDPDGKIVTGLDASPVRPNQRVFMDSFQPTGVAIDPGFAAVEAGSSLLPPSTLALPGDRQLGFDAVAFRTGQDETSNLRVWDGTDPVQFAPVPAGYQLQIEDLAGQHVTLDGSAGDVGGFDFVTTEPSGWVHEHLAFQLGDGDGNARTDPIDGTYLFGLQLTMEGLETSDPIFIALNTQGVGPDQANQSHAWLSEHVEDFSWGPPLQAGDANQDLRFDQLDLVQVQVAAKYLTGQTATWGEGDFDGAPGGTVGHPPQGDGQFDQKDIVAALSAGTYLTGPYAASRPDPSPVAPPRGGVFDATLEDGFGSLNFVDHGLAAPDLAKIARGELSQAAATGPFSPALTLTAAAPEPSAVVLLGLGLLALIVERVISGKLVAK